MSPRYFWRNLVHRDRAERELDDELRQTYALLVDEKVRAGMAPGAAERAARLELDGIEPVKEQVRAARTGAWVEALIRDVHYAFRALHRSPLFSLGVILSLTLGIGATTLVFSIVNGVLLRPLPIPAPDRVVFVARLAGADASYTGPQTYADYREFRDRSATFDGLVAFTQFPVAFEAGTEVSREMPAFVTGNYFTVLGVKPSLGRLLTPDDDGDGAPPVVVLDYDFWTSAYHSNPGILGSTLRLTSGRAAGAAPDTLYTVVGIAPRGFHGTDVSVRLPAWMPLHSLMPEARLAARQQPGPSMFVFGRLKQGISRQAAQGNLAAIARDLATANPAGGADYRVLVTDDVGWVRNWPAMRAFAFAVLLLAGLVLLAACAGVATSLTVRTIDRHREIGIRISLGASRLGVIRLILIEVLLMSAVSAAVALTIVSWTTPMLSQLTVPADPPIQFDVHPDARVFLLATLVSILASAITTVAAARAISVMDPNRVLKGWDGLLSDRRWTLRDLLTAAQVVFSCVLMAACVLSLVGLRRALAVPVGFDVDRLATVVMDFDVAKYTREQQRSFMERAQREVSGVPGVEAAAFIGGLPLGLVQNLVAAVPEGRPLVLLPEPVARYPISEGYFRTTGVRLLDGRDLSARDTGKALVNEAFARKILLSDRAVGMRLSLGNPNGRVPTESLEIVGVVADGKYLSLSESQRPAIFTPLYDTPFGRPTMVIRTSGSPMAVAGTARRIIAALDPRLPLRNVGSASQLIAPAFLANRVAAATLTSFGVVAMLLAMIGIHGVVSYAVSRRRREIGVRVALGAGRAKVIWLVVGRVAAVSGAGIMVGALAAVVLRRMLQQIVYLASADEPMVLGGVIAVMMLVVVAALVRPAIRSLRIEPIVALRSE